MGQLRVFVVVGVVHTYVSRKGHVSFFFFFMAHIHCVRTVFFIHVVNRVCNDATRLQPVFAIVDEIYRGVSRMKNSSRAGYSYIGSASSLFGELELGALAWVLRSCMYSDSLSSRARL